MFDSAINFVTAFQYNSIMGILLYWVPLVLCIAGSTFEVKRRFLLDISERNAERAKYERQLEEVQSGARFTATNYYSPSITVGSILGMILLSIIPVINIFRAVFEHAPTLIKQIFDVVEKLFDIPLVPK